MLLAIVFLIVLSTVSLAVVVWILRAASRCDAARAAASRRTQHAMPGRDPRAAGVAAGPPTAAAAPPSQPLAASPEDTDVHRTAAAL